MASEKEGCVYNERKSFFFFFSVALLTGAVLIHHGPAVVNTVLNMSTASPNFAAIAGLAVRYSFMVSGFERSLHLLWSCELTSYGCNSDPTCI
jgi:hypothetical protein